MTDFESGNIIYQSFEISTNDDIYEANDIKLKHQRKKILRNKIQKVSLIFCTFLFFFLFIITLILYQIKSNEYQKLEGKVMDHIFFPYHSELIPSLKILKKLKKWIKNTIFEKTGKKYNPSLRMYYKATRDGDYTFHEKTDKWEGYIILIKDIKDNIFGGYTSKNFRGNFIADFFYGLEKNDKTAFLFNLNKNEIYPVIKDNYKCHIYSDDEAGPVFGSYQNSDLYISFNFLSAESSSEFPKNFNLNGEKNIYQYKLRLTNGQKKFIVKELEVFRVNLLP
jgi:hypothetical protein